MGLMNKLRDKTHIILIILVVAFLATIVFEWGMNYLGLKGQQNIELATVNGKEIMYTDYESRLQFAIDQQKQQTGEEPDETMMGMMRDQIFDQMVQEILTQQEIERMGIRVTNQEILNWVYNSPQTLPDPIKKNFVDSTGQFNMQVYQQALATKSPEVTKFWSQVENYLKQILLSQKLQSIITGSVRVTDADVLQKYKDDNISANISYAFWDANSVPDASITVTDEDLKAYYDKNKNEFRTEDGVSLRYIVFSDSPTLEDSTVTEKQLRGFTKELKKFDPKDSNSIQFVNSNSLTKFNDNFVKPSELSAEVTGFLFGAKKDSVSDVLKSQDGYHLVRLLDSKEGDDMFVNASHILISFGTDTAGAKQKAEQILNKVKSGEDFGNLASQLSDDPGSKVKGGSLGWFTKGAMVKEFEEASMNGKIGDILGPVRTQFGYHIIKINAKEKKLFKVVDIKKPVKTSTKTRDAARKRAEDFVYITKKGNFDQEAGKINMKPLDIPVITKTSYVPGVGQSKALINFAFTEAKGSISDPIKVQQGYAIYLITDKIPAGYTLFDSVKVKVVTPKVKIEKKLDILKQQVADARAKITGNDINSLKAAYPQITIQSADSISVAKANPLIGSDNDFNNAVFKLQNGQLSDPIRTSKGYYIVQMRSITPFDQNKFNSQSESIRQSLITSKKQSIVQDWIASLKEEAVIVDNRDKFFR